MKKLFYLFVLFAVSLSGVSAQQSELQTFTIRGEIEGLMPGDSLVFERIILPSWKTEPAFDLVITEPDRFSYTGTQSHILYLLMSYKPVSGIPLRANRRGIELLVREGSTVALTGTTDKIYYCRREGGVYDDPLLQKYLALEDSIGMELVRLQGLQKEALEAKDTVLMKKHEQQINDFYTQNTNTHQRARELRDHFLKQSPSSEFYVVHCLQKVLTASFNYSQAAFERMGPEIQQSYYGKILKTELDKMELLQSGKPAPDFRLVTLDGKRIALGDFAGSPILFYHWGLCPGSIAIDQEVIALYEKYKEHGFQIIGITPDMAQIRSSAAETAPDAEFMGVLLKPVLQSMQAHPWLDAEEKNGNEKIVDHYVMPGFPYFILVSPDGKFIYRGFHDAFRQTKKFLAEQYPDTEIEQTE